MAAEIKGESVLVKGIRALVCPDCGYKTLHGSQMADYMKMASDVYRRKHGRLTSSQIRERRARLGMSQEQFAAHLPVGLASIKRWEMGQVQDQPMDRLIRLRTDAGEAYRNSKEIEALFTPRTKKRIPAHAKE